MQGTCKGQGRGKEGGRKGQNIVKISEMLDDDYYVIPSSIDEVMIVPTDSVLDVQVLRNNVVDINKSILTREQILSNRLFIYKKEDKKLLEVL